jgi:hypothetical protein
VPRLVLIAAVLAVPFAGCGEEEPSAPPPKVRVEVTAPDDRDVVDRDAVEVRGSVVPAGARVEVLGEAVEAPGGSFATEVELEPGSNIIDVAASAEGRSPTVAAVRVLRRMPVEIPDLADVRPDTAVQRLEALGLAVAVEEGGGILDDLFGGEERVCATDPEAGETVRQGTTVTITVERAC